MLNRKVLGLGVSLVVLMCVAGCPQILPDDTLGNGTGDTTEEPTAEELIVGKWRVYVRYAGVAETLTGTLNFYANGTCDQNAVNGSLIPGTCVAQNDGTVIADFSTTIQTEYGPLREDTSLELQVTQDECTGTCWVRACLGYDCEEANGTVEGVRIGKCDDLLYEAG